MDSATSSIKRCFLNHKCQYVGLVVLGKQEEKRVYEAILSYPWAVICSAHKPSLDVAGRFDRVYLIDRGKLFEAKAEQYARYCVD